MIKQQAAWLAAFFFFSPVYPLALGREVGYF